MYEEQKDGVKEYSQEVNGVNTYWLPVVTNTDQNNTQLTVIQRDSLCEYFISPIGKLDF